VQHHAATALDAELAADLRVGVDLRLGAKPERHGDAVRELALGGDRDLLLDDFRRDRRIVRDVALTHEDAVAYHADIARHHAFAREPAGVAHHTSAKLFGEEFRQRHRSAPRSSAAQPYHGARGRAMIIPVETAARIRPL